MKKKDRKFFSREDIGIIGSYSSFLALLLVATILAFRSFVEYMLEAPASSVEEWFLVLIIVIAVVFVVIPSIPIIASIVRGFKKRNYWLSFFLIFIICTYFFAIVFQFGYTLIDQVLK